MKSKELLVLAGFVALCILVGTVSAAVTAQSVSEWYPTINKPSWNPPNWVFAPVWTILYVMMAVAAWLVWRKRTQGSAVRLALLLFLVQLALNSLWTFLFFGARSPGLAMIEVLAFWGALTLTAWAFFRVSRPAGILIIPYLAWVSFASVLNFAIWQLN